MLVPCRQFIVNYDYTMQTGKKKNQGAGQILLYSCYLPVAHFFDKWEFRAITLSLKNPTPVSKLSTLKDKWKFYQWVVLEETESEKKWISVIYFCFSKDCLIYKKSNSIGILMKPTPLQFHYFISKKLQIYWRIKHVLFIFYFITQIYKLY